MADFIDITPKGVDNGKGKAGLQQTTFQETEMQQIVENPSNLTKEGIEEKINIWSRSSNSHVKIKYKTMLNKCRSISPSGKTKEGLIILSRDRAGEPTWVKGEAKPTLSEQVAEKPSTKTETKKSDK